MLDASSASKPLVVLGLLGSTLDAGFAPSRWDRWRPTVDLFRHEDLRIDRFELLHQPRFNDVAGQIVADARRLSPESAIRQHTITFDDPWDLEEVYGALHDFALDYPFDPESEEYLVHMTTGTHVAQICIFLLTEARYFPGRLLQTSPHKNHPSLPGRYRLFDLDLSRYDRIAERFAREHEEGEAFLKSGIDTRNAAFNRLIERIETVAIRSGAPLLLMGPTGAGKSRLARRIYELKKQRRQVDGPFVEVNCATLRGDQAMAALFGHTKGAFTGASGARDGLLRRADQGILFLDEIGELGADEQAMLLRAIESGRFLPVGSDAEVESDFQLIAGTNHDLWDDVSSGRFREDLLARINLWTFRLPGLDARPEDVAPNLDYELREYAREHNAHVTFNAEARRRFLDFATSAEATWDANFRDLNAAVIRMATLSSGGRITADQVDDEIGRLKRSWRGTQPRDDDRALLDAVLDPDRIDAMDLFDRIQLAGVIRVCRRSATLSDAGRTLFAVSRKQKKSSNDADRIRKYLLRHDLTFDAVQVDAS